MLSSVNSRTNCYLHSAHVELSYELLMDVESGWMWCGLLLLRSLNASSTLQEKNVYFFVLSNSLHSIGRFQLLIASNFILLGISGHNFRLNSLCGMQWEKENEKRVKNGKNEREKRTTTDEIRTETSNNNEIARKKNQNPIQLLCILIKLIAYYYFIEIFVWLGQNQLLFFQTKNILWVKTVKIAMYLKSRKQRITERKTDCN